MNLEDLLGDTDQGVIAFKIENGIFKIIPGILSDQPVTFNDADFDKVAPPNDDKCAYNHGPKRDFPIVSKDLGPDYNMYKNPKGQPIEANLKVEEMKDFMPDLYDYYRCQKEAEEKRKRQADLISQQALRIANDKAAAELKQQTEALERQRSEELARQQAEELEKQAQLARQVEEKRLADEKRIADELAIKQVEEKRLAAEAISIQEAENLKLMEEQDRISMKENLRLLKEKKIKQKEAADEERRKQQELEKLALEYQRKEEEKRRQQIRILENIRAKMENQFKYLLNHVYSKLLKELFKNSRTVISQLHPDIYNKYIVKNTEQMNLKNKLDITEPRMQALIKIFIKSYTLYKETFLKIKELYDYFTRDTGTMTIEDIKTAISKININNMNIILKDMGGLEKVPYYTGRITVQQLFEVLPDLSGIDNNELKGDDDAYITSLIQKILESDPDTATPSNKTTVRRRGGDRHNKTLKLRSF